MKDLIFKKERIVNRSSIYYSNDFLKKITIMKFKKGEGYIYKLKYYIKNKNTPFYLCKEYQRTSKKSITRLFDAINQVLSK